MFYFSGARKPDFNKIEKIDYDEYWRARGFHLNTKLKEREEMMLELIPKGSRVMDIGCGNSLLPVKLKEKGCAMSVGDISTLVLGGFKEHGISGVPVDLEKIDTTTIPQKLDYIILSEVLEHLRNPEDVIAKLSPHTRHFLITVPNSGFYRYRTHIMFGGRFFTQWVHHPSEHLRFWTHIDFLDWLAAQHVKVVHSESSNGFTLFGFAPSLKNLWKNLFGHQILYICSPLHS